MHRIQGFFRHGGVRKAVLFGFSRENPLASPEVLEADYGWAEVSEKDKARALRSARRGLLDGLQASGMLTAEQEAIYGRC